MPHWIVEGLIATSPRPGFAPGEERRVEAHIVDAWLQEVRTAGIQSVICLIAADQLWLYRHSVPEGLIERYRAWGLEVAHIPTMDQQSHPFSEEQYDEAWEAFNALPKPVLVHCSAGLDRTGRIVRHILKNLDPHHSIAVP